MTTPEKKEQDEWAVPRNAHSDPPGHVPAKQPYDDDCTWTLDLGSSCRRWRMASSSGPSIACYHWPPSSGQSHETTISRTPFKGAIFSVHGLGSNTPFQILRHSANGERKHRGLFYENSFVERLNMDLSLDVYALDLEGHGWSRPTSEDDKYPMHISRGIAGAMDDVQRLLNFIRSEHGLKNNQSLIGIGHSTGCLVLTRLAQRLQKKHTASSSRNSKNEDGGPLGGIISTAPLYGPANTDGTEIVPSLFAPFAPASILIRCILRLASAIIPRTIVTYNYITQADDDRDNSAIDPRVVQRSIRPGNFIETWVSGDRDLDPAFHSPYCPMRVSFLHSVASELYNLHANAGKLDLKQTPMYVVHSKVDPVVSFVSTTKFLRAVLDGNNNGKNGGDKEYSLDEILVEPKALMLHNVLLEEDGRVDVENDIVAWIEKRFSP